MLTRDQILAIPKPLPVEVDVPEWGGSVFVRGLTGIERDTWEVANARANREKARRVNIRAALLVYALCDKDGNSLFAPGQADALGSFPASILDRLYDVAAELSGIIHPQESPDPKASSSENGDTSCTASPPTSG